MLSGSRTGNLSFSDDPAGQKTGYFLDQSENRQALKPYVKGAKVLDCFCYSGAFSLYSALYGAQEVLGVDSSRTAIEQARRNAVKNGLTKVTFEERDVLESLRAFGSAGQTFDVIIMDPPAFAKQKKDVPAAKKGYLEINRLALELLTKHGTLVSCSCSHYLDRSAFMKILDLAAVQAKRSCKLVEFRKQPKDHPVLAAVPETDYLKCAILRAQ